ncbi:MAG TPA: AAA family ATPase [Fimbriiglobus sp.]|nr:AAA family ATPase [Fimbriiglobus sp.]
MRRAVGYTTGMDLPELIALLSRPEAYPHPVDRVEVRQTHISVVFLAGDFAYKVKKPVDLGFLDFTTLTKRRHFCDEETRLNRRLAPGVYRGVVPVTRDGIEGAGEAVEWAVKMARLPDEASLRWHVRHGGVSPRQVEALVVRIAEFHRTAEANDRIAAFGRFDVVAGNARENFAQSRGQVGTTVSRAVFDRLEALTEAELTCLRPVIESRATRGVPRDTHGDLRLEHVYLLPDGLAIIDCVEFSERFRFADPVADAAFLVMDLLAEGRPDLARTFAEAYFTASGDGEGRQLLPFYVAYRAAVRGKVQGMKAAEPEVPAADRTTARRRSAAFWLLALGQLEEPARRPCLVLIGGLPGTGKSTLARGLAGVGGFEVIRSDVMRKELAAQVSDEARYSSEWTERTYAECLRRTEALVFEGKRVIVDATFREDWRRDQFLAAAKGLGVPGLLLVCNVPPEVVQGRLAARTGDVSDADWTVYRELAVEWEALGDAARRSAHVIDTADGPAARAAAEGMLRAAGVL